VVRYPNHNRALANNNGRSPPPRHDRHGGDGVFGRAVHQLVGIAEINQRVVGLIVEAHHLQLLEQPRTVFLEDVFPVLQAPVNIDRPHLPAGDGGVRGVFGQPHRAGNPAGLGPADVADHAVHLGVFEAVDAHLIIGHAQHAEGGGHAAHLLGFRGARNEHGGCAGEEGEGGGGENGRRTQGGDLR
jgi:hypothetical protein